LRCELPLPLMIARRGDNSYVWRLLEYDDADPSNPSGEANSFVEALKRAIRRLESAYIVASSEVTEFKESYHITDQW